MFEEKTTESHVSVNLTANNLDAGSYIARVPRKPLDLDNIVCDIAAAYPGLDPPVIIHAAELIKAQVLSYIKEGKSVNILDIATVYIAPATVVTSAGPQVDDLPGFKLKFEASREAKAALAAVKAGAFMVKKSEPAIKAVISLKGEAEEGVLCRGYPVRATGDNLEVAGEGAGIFFVPADEDGAPERNEELWIAADTSYLPTNKPKKLEFYIPDEAEAGKSYFIAVRTRYNKSGKERKNAVTGFSGSLARIL